LPLRQLTAHIRSQNWFAVILDFAVVVSGIFVGLQVDAWNQSRVRRDAESTYVERLVSDLQTDLRDFDFRLQAIQEKEASLARVESAFRVGTVTDAAEFLADVITAANFGWNQGLSERSTFDELVATGDLGIIGDDALRLEISQYYRDYEDEHLRIEERETEYPNLSYQLVPRGGTLFNGEVVDESILKQGLSEAELQRLVERVLNSPMEGPLTAETNLAAFMRGITLKMQAEARSLALTLQNYRIALD